MTEVRLMVPFGAHLNVGLLTMRRAFFLLSLLLLAIVSKAQTGISAINVTSATPTSSSYSQTAPSDASNDIQPLSSYTINNGQGNNLNISSYTVSGTTYNNFLTPDTLAIRRTDGSRFINIWYTLITDPNPGGSPTFSLNLDPEAVIDADEIYKLRSVNAGYDNILVNVDDQAGGSIQAQTERVDIIWYTGIVTCEPDNAIFPVVERGGNDEIKVAAITSLDINGDPDGYSSMVLIQDSDWPQAGQTFNNYLILRRQTVGQNPLPLINIGTFVGQTSQTVQGVAVSFTELGIAPNQVVYGYSIFASDVDDAVHDLTDISTFPTNTTAANSGLDLVAGVTAAVSSDECLTPAIGPGGYKAALATWLKANETDDVTTSTEGSTVTDWQDHWIGNHDFTTDGTAPLYRSTSSTINFNETVDFTTTNRGLTTANNTDFNTSTFYTRKGINFAFRTNTTDITTRQVIYEQGGASRGINIYIESGSLHVHAWNRNNDGAGAPWNTSDNTISTSIAANTEYILTAELDGNSSTTGALRAYLNGQSFGTLSNVGLLYTHTGDITFGRSGGGTRYSNGSESNNNSFSGEISEFIYCNEPGSFPLAQRNRIESYLAIKYGITLNQSSPYNYVNAAGEVIFNTTLNASLGGYLEYNRDIAGIGRNDASELDQRESRSENFNSIVTVNNGGSFSSDNTWFIWGNDGGDANDLTPATDTPPLISNRIDRVWRVAETGETGNNSISFDLNEITFSGSPGATDISLLVASNSSGGNFSSATILTGGVIVGNTITFSNVNLADGEYFTLGTGFISCAPGNVDTNLSLWLKADFGTNSTSGEVTSWADQAGSNNATGTTGTVPSYSSNTINFNPALDFDGVDNVLTANAGMSTHGYYLVLVPDNNITSASGYQVPLGFDDSSVSPSSSIGGFAIGNLYGSIDDIISHTVGNGAVGYGRQEINNLKTLSSGIPLMFEVRENSGASQANISQNGLAVDNNNGGSYLAATNEEYAIGRFETPNDFSLTGFFDGKVAEIISYSARPSDAESERIQSYLAIKYGITIDQTTGQNYVNSAGSTIWDATTNATYNNDIAGIGRDDNSCLEQKQSKSVNSGSIVTIGNGGIYTDNATNPNSFSADQSFLVWGNDGADPAQSNANTLDVPGNVTERMETIWRVDETGTVGNTSVSFDLTGLGYSSVASDFQLIVSSSATMASGTTISGGTFNGNVLTFNNVDFADGDFFTLGTARTACGPGGVTTDLALWLKANEGTSTTTDNTDLASWNDFSGNNRNAVETNMAGGAPVEPTYQTNEINFNPAIQFTDPSSNNASFMLTTNGNNVSGDFTLITIFESGQSGGSTTNFEDAPILLGAGTSGTNLDYGLGFSGGRIHLNAANNQSLTVRSTSGTSYIDLEPYMVTATRVQSSGAVALFINSATNATATGGTNSFTNPTAFGIGNNPDPTVGSQFNGRIAESIVFSDDLTSNERQRVESYLALKYGITRNTTADYLASDGGTIWSYTSDAAYNSDIAGIGRDDGSCLVQLKSKSENNDALVTMSIPSFSADDSFLIWGNDNAPIENPDNREFNSSQVKSRLNREWHVQETGTVGNITLTYDLSTISGPSGIGTNNLNQVRLMVDDDGDFTSGVTLISPSSINAAAKTVSFTVNFTNGQYFTLGSEEVAALPIDLISFSARLLENNTVRLHWTTAAEQNNAYFTVERSQDGQNFDAIGIVEGAGESSSIRTYQLTDHNPPQGLTYYRLKQTDFNGDSEYSELVSVFIESSLNHQYVLYPNPVSLGESVTIRYTVDRNQEVFIEVLDMKGRSLYGQEQLLSVRGSSLSIPTKGLNRGLNLIKITDSNGHTTTLKLLVE
ncbi:T9SS type A sorting domain-containing protein [Roseivirga sp. UBA838]|uniref:T9SS type A sorting domain-containing protein n=1 Tax=Roseivirga sp. UBA838 TaxID=1947393 RepID=UPI00257B521A|nr:T9SS type A sorting domain-containing protein [Roseivirga sp. UBA838]